MKKESMTNYVLNTYYMEHQNKQYKKNTLIFIINAILFFDRAIIRLSLFS